MEVAARANASGCRVLHALPGEPALTTEELVEVVLHGNAPTLVLIDYLEQAHLDLGSIRRRLLPEAQKRGVALSLIADARPGYELRAANDWPVLFERVELRPSDTHARQISLHVQETIAPQAIRLLGQYRVAFLCGTRPIIALLIARELERRAHDGTLTPDLVAGLRSGDLIEWLRRRLREDDLAVKPSPSILRPAEPADELVTSAAVLAAAPQEADALQRVAEQVLNTGRPSPRRTDATERASFLIDVLCNLGWLEWRGQSLAAAHDVVADEVLEQALRAAPAAAVRRDALLRILSGCLRSPRTLGRYAISLGRLIGQEHGSAEGFFGQTLQEAASEWFKSVAAVLGAALLAADPDESSYALGAVLAGPPWGQAVVASWDETVQPWLDRHQTVSEARHLLYRGLRQLEADKGQALVHTANGWLACCGVESEATFVLGPLLARPDLEAGDAQTAIGHALSWLAIEAHRASPEAGFVLHPLLKCSELGTEDAQTAIGHALSWLAIEAHRASPDAKFVLHPLLERSDVGAEDAQTAIGHALSWLAMEAHRASPEADFVLRPLLERNDLNSSALARAAEVSILWLESHATNPQASFLLQRCLKNKRLALEQADRVSRVTFTWADANSDHPDVEFVINAFLRGPRNDNFLRHAIVLAVSWWRSNRARPDRDFTLNSLLIHWKLLGDTVLDEIVADALAWLRERQRRSVEAAPFLKRLHQATHGTAWSVQVADLATHYGVSLDDGEVAGGPATGRQISPFRELTADIDRMARRADGPVSVEFVRRALDEVGERVEAGASAAAGWALPGLLPLAARTGDTAQLNEATVLAKRIVPTLTPSQRTGLSYACYRLVDAGAWPDATIAIALLNSIGIPRPEAQDSG
jgi:hypothetical protein